MSDADSQTGGTDDRFTQTSGTQRGRPDDERTDQEEPGGTGGTEADKDPD